MHSALRLSHEAKETVEMRFLNAQLANPTISASDAAKVGSETTQPCPYTFMRLSACTR